MEILHVVISISHVLAKPWVAMIQWTVDVYSLELADSTRLRNAIDSKILSKVTSSCIPWSVFVGNENSSATSHMLKVLLISRRSAKRRFA